MTRLLTLSKLSVMLQIRQLDGLKRANGIWGSLMSEREHFIS